MADKLYVGDVGTLIIVDCGQDISSSTSQSLKVKKPDGTTVSWSTGVVVYNTNYLKYTILTDDLDQDGRYLIQAALTLGTWIGLGETDIFTVYKVYE